MIQVLHKPYQSRYGSPILTQVHTDIFTKTYFTHCLQCTFCNDACCAHGVDVAMDEVKRIEERGEALARYTQVPREQWFDGTFHADADFPGQGCAQTSIGPRGCIFLSPMGLRCLIHAFCLQQGIDYHLLKPMVCCLFPVTFHEGLLAPSLDVDDHSLICLDQGASLYAGVREELGYYFGDEFVAELDALEAECLLPNILARSIPDSPNLVCAE